jgi:DNA-binding NtrC family response regulator
MSVDEDGVSSASFLMTVTRGAEAGQTLTVDGTHPARLLVGQSPICELRLSDPAVSRRHLALDVAHGRLRVTDLGSTNGTAVNGLRIHEALLQGGEEIRLGATVLSVSRGPSRSRPAPSGGQGFGRLAGVSEEMRRLYPLCRRLADAAVPVIIEGETGTGKEVLAESLHEQGPRARGPFVVFDCTAVAPSLMESELFGHEKGAFSGATAARRGLFEQAHGGTLLIDEIGDLDLSLQPKLLRVLERGEVRRVGGDRPIAVDVRILAATRLDLDLEVQERRFRDDLFHRLAVGRIELPPLRERQGDIRVLAQIFWAALRGAPEGLDPGVLARWERYDWPGNVRQLRNSVTRHFSVGDLEEAAGSPDGIPAQSSTATLEQILDASLPFGQARQRTLADFERRYVERALAKHGGNVARAAAASGLARRYFQIIKARSK